jgi:hypothetical protein
MSRLVVGSGGVAVLEPPCWLGLTTVFHTMISTEVNVVVWRVPGWLGCGSFPRRTWRGQGGSLSFLSGCRSRELQVSLQQSHEGLGAGSVSFPSLQLCHAPPKGLGWTGGAHWGAQHVGLQDSRTRSNRTLGLREVGRGRSRFQVASINS